MKQNELICRNNIYSHGWKKLLFAVVFVFHVCGSMWGEELRFQKSIANPSLTSSDNWHNNKAWQKYGTGFLNGIFDAIVRWVDYDGYPGENDDIYFWGESDSTCKITNSDAKANNIYVNHRKENSNESVTTGTTTLELDGKKITAASLNVSGGKLIISGNGTVEITDSVTIASGAELDIGSNVKLEVKDFTNNGVSTLSSNITVKGNLTNNDISSFSCSSVSFSSGDHNIYGPISLNGLSAESGSNIITKGNVHIFSGINADDLTVESGKLEIKSNFEIGNITINNGAEFELSDSIVLTVKGNWTDNSTGFQPADSTVKFAAAGQSVKESVPFNNIELSQSTITIVSSLSVTGNTIVSASTAINCGSNNLSLNTVTPDAADRTFTVNGTGIFSLSGNAGSEYKFSSFSLNGADASHRLTVKGNGRFVMDSAYAEVSASFVKFDSASPEVRDSGNGLCYAVALDSEASDVFPSGWINGDTTYVWLGKKDTSWDDSVNYNWAGNRIPVNNASTVIRLVPVGVNYPVMSDDVSVSELIIEKAGASITTGTYTLSVASYSPGTNGKLIVNGGGFTYTGNSDLTVNGLLSVSGSVNIKSQNKNLTFNDVTYDSEPSLVCEGLITLKGGSIGSLTVISGKLYYSSDLTVNGDLDNKGLISPSASEILTFGKTGNQSIKTGNNAFGEIVFGGSGTKSVTGNFEAGKVTVNADVEVVFDTQSKFNGNVSNSGTVTLGTGNTVFVKDYYGVSGVLNGTDKNNGATPPVNFDPEISFGGNITFGIFNHLGDSVVLGKNGNQTLVTGDNNFSVLIFSGNGSKSVSGALTAESFTIRSGAIAELDTTGSFSGDVSNNGTLKAGSGNLTFGGNYSGTSGILEGKSAGAKIYFKKNAAFGTYKSNGESVCFNGSVKQIFTANGQIFSDIIFENTHTDGVVISGNLSADNISNTKKTDCGNGKITLYKNLSNTGIFTAPTSLELSGTTETEITGVYRFNNLYISNDSSTAVKTVVFPVSGVRVAGNGIEISGEFKVTGKNLTAGGKNIVIKSSGLELSESDTSWWWLEKVTVSKINISNAEIGNAYSTADISSKVKNCVESKCSNGAYTTYHWFSGHQFYWFGASDNSWETGSNWSVSDTGTPVMAVSPKTDDETAIITIKKGSSIDNSNLLILEKDISIKSLTVDSNVRINLDGRKITADSITNKGIVAVDGSSQTPLVKRAGGIIIHDEDSTIEYTACGEIETTYAGLGLSDSYNKLKISGLSDFTFKDSVLSVLKTADFSCSKVSSSGPQIYKGTVNSSGGIEFDAGTETITLEGGSVSSDSAILFGSPLILKADTSIYSSGAGTDFIIFESTVNGAFELNVEAPVIEYKKNVGAVKSLSDIISTGIVKITGAEIKTAGSQIYDGPVTLNSNIVTLTAGSTASFTSTVDGQTAGSNSLLIKGNAVLNGSCGNTYKLSSLEITGTSDLTCDSITTDAGQSFGGAVTVFSDIVLNGSKVIFKNKVDDAYSGQHSLTVLAPVEFYDETGALKELKSISVGKSSAPQAALLKGSLIKTSENQLYTGTVTLGKDVILSGAKLTFNNLIDSQDATPRKLKLVGNTELGEKVGSVRPLASLTVGDDENGIAKTVLLKGEKIITTGNQLYTGTVMLGTDNTLSAYKVIFNSSVDSDENGPFALMLLADSELSGGVGENGALSSLQVGDEETGGSRATLFNDGHVKTTGIQLYTGDVTLANDSIFNGTEVVFKARVDSGSTGVYSLNLNADSRFYGPVGMVKELSSLVAGSSASPKKTLLSGSAVVTGGNQVYSGSVLLGSDNTLSGTNITFGSTLDSDVNGVFGLNIEAHVEFDGKIGDTKKLYSVRVGNEADDGARTALLKGLAIITEKTQLYTGDVTLESSNILTGSEVAFRSTVDGNKDLIVLADVIFDKSVGTITKLLSLEVGSLLVPKNAVINGEKILTDGDQLYYGHVSLGENLIIEGKDFIFGGNIQCQVSQKNLILDGHNIDVNGTVSVSDLMLVATDTIFHQPVTVRNYIQYGGKVELSADLKTSQDVVLHGKDDVSITPEYLYTKKRLKDWNFKKYDEAKRPVKIAGVLEVKENHSVDVGENFYAYKMTLTGLSEWYLDVKKNADAKECFIEAYLCDLTNSVVRFKDSSGIKEKPESASGMAQECTFDGGILWSQGNPSGSNRNWDFESFHIVNVFTVSDSVICVEFNKPVRNLNNELTLLVKNIHFDSGNNNFEKIYKDFSYKKDTLEWKYDQIGNTEINRIFLQTKNDEVLLNFDDFSRWNTDATGISSGNSYSTDSHGKHSNVIPNLMFERDVSSVSSDFGIVFTDRFGKILSESGTIFRDVIDKTAPVLVGLFTGQETHDVPGTVSPVTAGLQKQHSYDAHNFIEFVYSEAVDMNGGVGNPVLLYTDTDTENIQVTDTLGKITSDSKGLSVAGLVNISGGELKTGSIDGTLPGLVHTFYRKNGMNPNVFRLSVAGLVNGSVTDNSGKRYNRWTGYIDEGSTPEEGVSVSVAGSVPVYDIAEDLNNSPIKNQCEAIKSGGLSVVNMEADPLKVNDNYGYWDVSKPVFALYRKASALWEEPSASANFESIGSTVDGTSSIKRIEFHFFDNTPDYGMTEPQWVSKMGWVNPYTPLSGAVMPVLKDPASSYAADIFGGAREFDGSSRTRGGIRYCSISEASSSFKYGIGKNSEITTGFKADKKAYFGASSAIFQPVKNPSRSPDEADGLYFGYDLSENVLSLRTQFHVKYDGGAGFVTDLAGNRMKSSEINTIDLTPPSLNMTVAPIGEKRLYVMFSKNLEINGTVSLPDDGGTPDIRNALETYPESFILCTISDGQTYTESTGNQIDPDIPAKVLFQNEDYMGLEFTLTKNVTLWDVENLYLVAKQHNEKNYRDPVIGLPTSYATFIQDDTGIGNYMLAFTAHALSDFAVNLVDPLFAYNQHFATDDESVQFNLYSSESKAVHDWNAEQHNYGTLLTDDEIHIISAVRDETLLEETDFNVRLYASNKPDSESVSTEYNRTSKSENTSDIRVWLPSSFSAISETENSRYETVYGEYINEDDLGENLDFLLPVETVNKWTSGDQVSFLFEVLKNDGVTSRKICHSPSFDYGREKYNLQKDSPLFALRLKNPSDILSLDLWSFRLKKMSNQSGGVTILNNVIDAKKGEKAVVKMEITADTPKVDIIVMTLDGNVIEYLSRGKLEKGTHYFSWNGTNKNGKQVARGMYFIRVIGSGFDETRKVMVTK